MNEQSPLIAAEGVTRTYHGSQVVQDVSLQVEPGESVVILGPSGAGKSTLLRCLAGLEPIQAGQIIFRGAELSRSGRSPHLSCGDIGMVFQQFNLFPHLTAVENVALAPTRVRRVKRETALAEARQLLARVGLAHRADHYPFELSGGQQQRVAIARALAMHPALMLFDEPTSALDPEFTREVLEVMRALAADGMTIIVVTHEMAFARGTADRVVVMDHGRIVEDGPTEQVFMAPRHERTERFLRQVSTA
ncbi:amino acid ABC transporter ATP-binding protein [Micromonospora sp. NPDC047740]|uniref:amino acid ABC transporter ATP-binding protein n=1 Tax=Micromonospora sp. NPDC047740 TaxID=3364254 RepID=UPI003721D25E